MSDERENRPVAADAPPATPEAEAEERNDDPKAAATILVGVLGAIFVFVVIVALQALFYTAEEAERVSKIYSQAPEELARLRAQQQEALHSYHWVDQTRGQVAIPIERAMELVVQDQGSGTNPRTPPTPTTRPTTPAPHQ